MGHCFAIAFLPCSMAHPKRFFSLRVLGASSSVSSTVVRSNAVIFGCTRMFPPVAAWPECVFFSRIFLNTCVYGVFRVTWYQGARFGWLMGDISLALKALHMAVRTHRPVDMATHTPFADVLATSPHGFHIFVFFGSCRCDQGGLAAL